jgi:HPt (histidine-containing phosphotransfer) domain-containing protein
MVQQIEDKMTTDIPIIAQIYAEFENLKTLNLATFQDLRQSIDDDLVFSDLVTIYLNSAENLIADIRLAFIDQDASKFGLASHSLKSTSASIGADKLSKICRYFEKTAKTGNIAISSQMLELLIYEYDEVIHAIKASVIEFMTE